MGNILCFCRKSSDFKDLTVEIIEQLEISDLDKLILNNRFIKIVSQMDIATKYTSSAYHCLSLMITVGSILVPAMLSVQDKPLIRHDTTDYEKERQAHRIFWTTFAIALFVSIANGVIKLFSIDQTYIIRHMRYNDMRREGWLFFELTGPYKKYRRHSQAIKAFIYNIEKIKTNHLKEEYTPENSDQKELNTYDSYTLQFMNPNNIGIQTDIVENNIPNRDYLFQSTV